jgi:phosphate transport system substrate-binding protein
MMEDISGEVFVSGSSTVEPISAIVAEKLEDQLSDVTVTVEGPGTGDGFAKFCAGESDISDASRPIRDSEIEDCAANGIEYTELRVAIDGLSVITNPNNTAVECLDRAALYSLVGPESEGFDNWSDGNDIAGELGSGYLPLPDAPLAVVGPGVESGTYDTLVEFVAGPFAEDRGQEDTFRSDYTASPNDNVIVEGIEGNDTSLGWVGYAFYTGEQGKLKAVAIDDGDGCVLPTDETVADESYPFSRSLFIYVNDAKAAANPAVRAFVDLYLTDEGLMTSVSDAGYVQLTADAMAETRSAWPAS